MKTGWLVNDTLTCIPGTKTLWHDLLEWLPELVDMTGGYTDYSVLSAKIKAHFQYKKPDFIIRNASFFPWIDLPVPTISLLQDVLTGDLRKQQEDVLKKSSLVVVNSRYTYNMYKDILADSLVNIIPLGIDFDFFCPQDSNDCRKRTGILPKSILFVGSSKSNPKGFDLLTRLIDETSYNYILVMKDNYVSTNPRVKVFNKINHALLKDIYSSCAVMVCTSKIETQHLAGIEAAACNIPLLTTPVGAHADRPNGRWGRVAHSSEEFIKYLDEILTEQIVFSPREDFIKEFDKKICRVNWIQAVEGLFS